MKHRAHIRIVIEKPGWNAHEVDKDCGEPLEAERRQIVKSDRALRRGVRGRFRGGPSPPERTAAMVLGGMKSGSRGQS
jgi:hypothetical protein